MNKILMAVVVMFAGSLSAMEVDSTGQVNKEVKTHVVTKCANVNFHVPLMYLSFKRTHPQRVKSNIKAGVRRNLFSLTQEDEVLNQKFTQAVTQLQILQVADRFGQFVESDTE